MDPQPLELSTAQQFEIERFGRAIDATRDPAELRGLAKQLLACWFQQKAATAWMMRQAIGAAPRITMHTEPARPLDVL